MCADIPRETSFTADEGTAAHQLAARCLVKGIDAIEYLGASITVEQTDFIVTEQMVEAVQLYLDTIRTFLADGYQLEVEVKLDLGHLSPGQFGTGDAILFHGKQRHLVVADLKYGKHVQVDPRDNPQLLSYASGAAQRFPHADTLSLIVVQPRQGDPVRRWDTSMRTLRHFETDFRAAVEEASAPDAPLFAGEWCRFCPANGSCPEYRQLALRLAQAEFSTDLPDRRVAHLPDPTVLNPTELGSILLAADIIEHWIEAVRSHALKQALAGVMPEGHKLVRKNTLRRWVDEQKAAQALTLLHGLDVDSLWVAKLISPAQAEKLLPARDRPTLASLITRPEGDATLAPLSDKRPPMNVDARTELIDTLKQSAQNVISLNPTMKPKDT
jgi:hypothetical protein